MIKTFRDNCDINIVQHASCELLFPDDQMQLKMHFKRASIRRLRVAYNFECRALYNQPC